MTVIHWAKVMKDYDASQIKIYPSGRESG